MPQPVCDRISQAKFQIGGYLAEYIQGVTEQWLLVAPLANPAMLEMYRDRDRPPLRDLVPWAGEFAGKYLTSAVQVLRLSGDGRLRAWLQEFVPLLLQFQDADGYLGPWPQAHRLTNTRPDGKSTWDTWAHYHLMLGLMLWHEEAGDQRALDAAMRIADLICHTYLGDRRPRLVDTPDTDKNLAPAHALCMLHRKTGEQRYLDMALQIVDEFAAEDDSGPLAGDYLRRALAGEAFYESPKPRWESLHSIMALAELHWITGEGAYRQAFEQLWWSMVQYDRHNNGGFTSGEKATGNPYDPGPIETCCTVAWIALSVEMLKLTANPVVADELELSTLNSIAGAHSPTGRWATYNTPMDGLRRASAHDIVFQARPGSPELNCCSVNSPRGFGTIGDWALMADAEGLVLNWYGPSKVTAPIPGQPERSMTLTQETAYPLSGAIRIKVDLTGAQELTLKLRIPQWSDRTQVRVNGSRVPSPQPGTYLCLQRPWQAGDTVLLDLDMSLHLWPGERECDGPSSLYRGPILMAFDHRYNLDISEAASSAATGREWGRETRKGLRIPALDGRRLRGDIEQWPDWLPPTLLLGFDTADGERVHLCDFGSAGVTGTPYATWLPVLHAPQPAAFAPQHPLPSRRL